MTFLRGRLRKWFPITLGIAGGVVFFAGIFVAAFSVTIPATDSQRINLPLHGAVYIGENTCYTCHRDETENWSVTLHTQTFANPVQKPEVILTDLNFSQEILQIHTRDLAEAYTTESQSIPAGNSISQHYVIQTDNGRTVHPGQWDAAEMEAETRGLSDSSVKCSGCHLSGFVAESLSINAPPLPLAVDPAVITRKYILRIAYGSEPTEYAIVEGHSM